MAVEDQLVTRFARDFPRGSVLFREGEPGKEMFVVRTGLIGISKNVRGREKFLSTLGPGEFFGEMSVLNGRPRTATATVLEDAQVLVIDPKTFESMLRGNGEIALRMIKKLADRLAEADAQIENLLLHDPSSRVVHYLLHALGARGKPEADGTRVPLQIADLPATLGLTPEQVKTSMQTLTKAKVATFAVDSVLVRDAAKLRELKESSGVPTSVPPEDR
jgi:CRP/FNR family transcriptional regulator, cyclic AMP receptor protein